MKVINKKMCVIVLLVMIEIGSLFLMYKSNLNKEIKLDNVIPSELKNNKTFAIMVEQSNGTYQEGSWPSDTTYVLNTLKSGCVDNDGNKIENGMTFNKNNRTIKVNTNKTSNCYAYFTRSAQYKIQNSSDVWKTNRLSNDGYRYDGTSPKNYVCFGTQSKSECVSDTDKYMYRIIGMFQEETTSGGYNVVNSSSNYYLKLIKKEALNEAYQWHSDKNQEVRWSGSDLNKNLNGEYFLTNREYSYMQEDFWYSKIMNWKWNSVNSKTATTGNTGIDYKNYTATNIYLDEMNRSTRPSASKSDYDISTTKIGLMYMSDYMLSIGYEAIEMIPSQDRTDLIQGWIHLSNNDSTAPTKYEKTLAYYSYVTGDNAIWQITQLGLIGNSFGTNTSSVRPVFYLNSDVVICSGTGTSSNPYILG